MAGTTGRLLTVDDEPDINHLIDDPAREVGFEVMSINDTDQFEKALQQFKPSTMGQAMRVANCTRLHNGSVLYHCH